MRREARFNDSSTQSRDGKLDSRDSSYKWGDRKEKTASDGRKTDVYCQSEAVSQQAKRPDEPRHACMTPAPLEQEAQYVVEVCPDEEQEEDGHVY